MVEETGITNLKNRQMNIRFKKNSSLDLVLIFTLICFLLGSCNTSKHGDKGLTIKNWVNWEVIFKENLSAEEKNKALLSIDKYILDAAYSSPAKAISFISIYHIPVNDANIVDPNSSRIQVNLGTVARDAVPHPRPPCCQPPIMPPGVREIREIGRSE